MQVSVKTLTTDCVELAAPLNANSNLHGTAFGGSIASLAVLCGWTWLNTASSSAGIHCDLVVQKTEMSYESAITEDFYAQCNGASNEDWKKFLLLLQKRGRARIEIPVSVRQGESIAASLVASYAAKTNR